MEKKIQGIVLGVFIAAMIMGSTTVLAGNARKIIDAVYMNIRLVIDGEEITPKDANGNIAEPFIYNGTTYLPVRAIGEAFGKDVSWDRDTATVYVGEIVKPAKEVLLFDKPYIECGDSSYFFAGKTNNDYSFTNFIGFDFRSSYGEQENGRYYCKNYVVYPLDGLAKKVKGTFMPTNQYGACEYQFYFYDESGKMLYQSPIMTGTTAPIDFEFETGTALKLKIECTGSSSSSLVDIPCAINNAAILTTDY